MNFEYRTQKSFIIQNSLFDIVELKPSACRCCAGYGSPGNDAV
jgi:hypothetical protein